MERTMAGWWTALTYALSLAVPFWVWRVTHPFLTGLDSTARALAWGRLCGLVGAVCLVWQILFISRVKLLEGRFGLDRLTRWHHLNAFVAVLCLLLHAPLVTWANAQNALVSMSEQLLDFWRTWHDLPEAMVGAVLLVLLTVAALRPLRRFISYTSFLAVGPPRRAVAPSDRQTPRGFHLSPARSSPRNARLDRRSSRHLHRLPGGRPEGSADRRRDRHHPHSVDF